MLTLRRNERQYRRKLPHFQNSGCWYHLMLALRPTRRLDATGLRIVFDACRFHDGMRWNVAALAAMPRASTHILCYPLPRPGWGGRPWKTEVLVHSVKSYSAHALNKAYRTEGSWWGSESFERQIRDDADFWNTIQYVANNPVKEGLCASALEYPWFYAPDEIRKVVLATERWNRLHPKPEAPRETPRESGLDGGTPG